jgi:hypothetical protein
MAARPKRDGHPADRDCPCRRWPTHIGPPFTRSQFHHIQVGMTREEALAILGKPGRYGSIARELRGPTRLEFDHEGDMNEACSTISRPERVTSRRCGPTSMERSS